MNERLIAIVGSAAEGREYEPPVHDAQSAREAAEILGTALAVAGYRLMVYSAEAEYIERDVVRGFIKSGKAKAGSILVFFPAGADAAAAFPERIDHEEIFNMRPESSSKWQITFFRSLAQADGVILIGGGRSTLITGVLALTYRIPLLALAAYGGNAGTVWNSLVAGRDLPSESEIHCMAEPGRTEVVKRWIDCLEAQFRNRSAERRNVSSVWPSVIALVLLILWVGVLPVSFLMMPTGESLSANWHRTVFVFLLFLAPLVSGASGASIRTLLPAKGMPSLKTTILGVAAGAIASILYVLGQVMGNSSPYNFTVLAFSVAFGFVAGFTFDTVFKKLESIEITQTDILNQKKP